MRQHYYRPIRNAAGDLSPSKVALHYPGTSTEIVEPVFSARSGSAQRTSHWTSLQGVVDFYLTAPMVVDIEVTSLVPGSLPVTWSDQWVGDVEGPLPTGDVAAGQAPVATPLGWRWGTPTTGVSWVVHPMTQFEYDSLPEVDPNALYVILEGD